jgi:peptide/nickel transport system permease protein
MANFRSDPTMAEFLYRAFLPALTLTLVVTAHMMRMTRAAIINLLASPYIEMARLKGMKPMRIIVKHALPNALAPIINVVALNLAYLITGVVVVEVVFVYPGLGQLMVDSVAARDMPVVQGIALVFAAAYVLLNLTADVLATCPTRASCTSAEGGRIMGFLTGLFWLAAVIVAAMASGWIFRTVAIAVSPHWVAREFRTMPLTAGFGLLMILIYVAVALLAPLIAPFPETEIVGPRIPGLGQRHLLGTDNLGRDMLSRLIYGARNTVGIAFATTALAFILGSVLGLLAAVVGGWLDQLLSRTVDVLMAIPALIFALLLLTIVGTSIINMILVIALIDATRVFRLARAVAMNIVVMDYVEAAKLRGEGLWYLITREILPNALAPLVAEFGLRFCFVFLPSPAVLPRPRHPAAHRGLGLHGARQRDADLLRRRSRR